MREGPWLIMYKKKRAKEVKAAWRRVRAAAGLDGAVQPYSLRHTVARYLRASGVPAWGGLGAPRTQAARLLDHRNLCPIRPVLSVGIVDRARNAAGRNYRPLAIDSLKRANRRLLAIRPRTAVPF